jgi:hypothetical protein
MSAAGALTGGTSTATATAGEGTDGTEKRTTPKTLRHFGKCSSMSPSPGTPGEGRGGGFVTYAY